MLKNRLILTFAALLLMITTGSCAEPSKDKGDVKVYTIVSASKGENGKAIDFVYEENGKQKKYSDLTKNKSVFLNFWGTWCGPCRMEIPDIVKIDKELTGKDFIVVGIALERNPNDMLNNVRQFVKNNNISYIVLVDEKRALQNAYGGISGVPTTFFIDKSGNIVDKVVGAQSKEAFMTMIKKIKK